LAGDSGLAGLSVPSANGVCSVGFSYGLSIGFPNMLPVPSSLLIYSLISSTPLITYSADLCS
jgi:hypothetical protein